MTLPIIFAMAWKSAVISGVALLLVALLRKRAAADRAALLRVGVLLLLLLPLISTAFPALTIETAPEAASAESAALPALTAAELAALAAQAPASSPEASILGEADLLAGLAYLAGLILIGLRFGAGLLTLRRWTREGREVTTGAWAEALERQAPKGRALPLLVATGHVAGPISWGLGRPVILLDPQSLERPEDADAVLAHEMAHVTRRDWLGLLLARTAVALFWFNPLVWLLEREVVQHAEEAADSHALERVEAVRYAETLLTCAQRCSGARVPANSIAGSGRRLSRRVKAVLSRERRSAGSRWTLAAILGCIALGAPVAAMRLVEAAPPPAPSVPAAPPAPNVPLPARPAAAPAAPAAMALAVQAPAPVAAPPSPRAYGPTDEELDDMIDEAAIERAAEAAEEIADRAAGEAERIAERIAIDGERLAANAGRISEAALRAGRAGQLAGANAMLKGADSMEAGARRMDEEAEKLRSKDYRQRQIAKASAQGRRLTHEELIEAIPEMKRGAREMREGAREMRAGAAEMRRNGI